MSEEIKQLYVVMPFLPADGYVLQTSSIYNNALQGIAGFGYAGVTPDYFVFHHDYVKAKLKALEYTKLYNKPYYVATIQIDGRFVPPPPEFIPAYEVGQVEWKKP